MLSKDLVYPIYPSKPTFIEYLAARTEKLPGFCTVCGRIGWIERWSTNYRESGICQSCQSTNRHRQVAYVICQALSSMEDTGNHKFWSLAQVNHLPISIYNTESSGSLHDYLFKVDRYVCSEFLNPDFEPGKIVDGIRHEDLQKLSFPDSSFDLIVSSDVFEHVPNPYTGHREVFRVLKPGGRHIFTVPFHQTSFCDEVLAMPGPEKPIHVKAPVYHLDPLRPEGVLVYTIFSLEMLIRLKEIGFQTHLYKMYDPVRGILGPNGLVFESIKV